MFFGKTLDITSPTYIYDSMQRMDAMNNVVPNQKYSNSAQATLNKQMGFAKGGMVKRTGSALIHKGEMVVPKKYVKDVPKSLKMKIKKNGGRNM